MESATGPIPIVKVLFTLYPGMDALNVLGPLEILNKSCHDTSDPATRAFECVFAAATPTVETSQGVVFKAQTSYEDVQKRLADFDILIIPGGDHDAVLKDKAQPLQIIKAFSDVQQKYPNKERTMLAVGTASLFLAQLGLLAGLSATTHPDYYAKFENICARVAQHDLTERPNLLEERYVVNNLRFDIGDEDVNPYIRRKSDARRPSNARKGSNAWKESNTRRESNARRASMLLGGLRVITAGGTGCGMDAALYLVSIMVSLETAQEVARVLQHNWTKGVVVDGLDV